MNDILRFMRLLEWEEEVNYGGQTYFLSHDQEYEVLFGTDGSWYLGKFTDGDIRGVAMGRYELVDDGSTLEELKAALREIPIESMLKLVDQSSAQVLVQLYKMGFTAEQAVLHLEQLLGGSCPN